MTPHEHAFSLIQGARGSLTAGPAPAAMGFEDGLLVTQAEDGSFLVSEMNPYDEALAEMGAEAVLAKVKTDAPKVAATAALAVVGVMLAGPLGLLLGGALGGGVDFWRHKKKHAMGGASAGSPDSSTVAMTSALANMPPIRLKPLTMSTLQTAAPNIPKLKLIKMATAAKTASPAIPASNPNTAAANTAAQALYAYLNKYPLDRQVLGDAFWKNAAVGGLTKAFQTAYNADGATSQATGQLTVNGIYDSRTAGALTFYTHEPIDPDPKAG